ncbi:hypothetical protein ASC94_01635 [Massilia sp. Root418]|nr:hypothetical protein ASC94_01635 [Massilia sp. Root418]
MDCSACDLPNQSASSVTHCQLAGPLVFKDTGVSNLGTRQIPLLHLVYEICTQQYGPEAREGRKTWLAQKYSEKTHKALARPKYQVSVANAKQEVHHLIGMLLAQRAHFLPIWAQLSRAGQMEVAGAIASLLKGGALTTDLLSRGQAEMFKGSAHLAMEGAAADLKRGLERAGARIEKLGQEINVTLSRLEKAVQALGEFEEMLQKCDTEIDSVAEQGRTMENEQDRIRQFIPDAFNTERTLYGELAIEFLIDSSENGDKWEADARAAIARFRQLDVLKAELGLRLSSLRQERQFVAERHDNILKLVRPIESLYDSLEQAWLDFLMMQFEWSGMSAFAAHTRNDAQRTLQAAALDNDYALQPGNYMDPKECEQLTNVLKAHGAAREMFLFMDPRLKYQNSSKVACRIRKFLGAPQALEAFQALDDANLIQPGPYAKLGVFVINALTPGSYDQRHRVLVQRELEMIVQGMAEHGMDPTISCHSCGSTHASGKPPTNAATDWIRDHNPPTALYRLGRTVYHDKLGLPDYTGNGTANGQILLPQCRECSKRQGAITAKAVGILELLPPWQLTSTTFDLSRHLKDTLEADDPQDWVDFQRLVCNPKAGWRTPNDLSGALTAFNLDNLVVRGGAGSFTGIDEAMLKNLGVAVGCHTCTDVPVQNNPYRNISWIADHQPPTALVARGLMELPQIVYPHCWDCSETQAQMVAKLCRLFEQCFGKEHKKEWVAFIKDQAWSNLLV